jgi:hypothetical protein
MRPSSVVCLALLLVPLAGCARGGPGDGTGVPKWIVRFIVDFAGPVDDTSFYFIAIDADNDFGVDGPLPVAAGPFWGNGWGTGSITHFVSYNQGRFDLYLTNRQVDLELAAGGIVDASGSPDETDTGQYELTVSAVTLGAATLSGTGTIADVTNDSDQNAGTFALETDAQGRTVADSVSFTPASDGGRAPTSGEQSAIDALNAGGVLLAADSLAAFGLSLSLGAPQAGVQTIDVAPAVADVDVSFRSGSGQRTTSTGTLTANSNVATQSPPVPGVTFRTETLVAGQTARLRSETAPTASLIGPPYEAEPPFGGNTLDVTIDLDRLGQAVDNLSINFISTTELIFDPIVTDQDLNVYDALGVQGNDYVTFSTRQTRTIRNGDWSTRESGGTPSLRDPTLSGPATEAEKDAVDIIDWMIAIERLS